MELGQRSLHGPAPRCQQCPVAALCRANQQSRQVDIPRPKVKRAIEAVRQAAVIVRRRGRVLLLRWPEGGRFGACGIFRDSRSTLPARPKSAASWPKTCWR